MVGQAARSLIERERELAALKDALAGTSTGSGRVVVLQGEAGLGKTRLLGELRRNAGEAGTRVLYVRGAELERDFPFGVIGDLLRPVVQGADPAVRERLLAGVAAPVRTLLRLDADVTTALEPSQALLDAVFWVVDGICAESRVVICVDDAHLVDAPSLRALAYLAHRVEALPLVLAAAHRTGAQPTDADALRALGASPHATTLVLAPLTAAGTAAMARRASGGPWDADPTALHAVTGGNPLLVAHVAESVARDGIGGLSAPRALTPTAVSGIILQRLAGASPAAQAVARAVSVLGDNAPVPRVAALAELSADATVAAAAELDQLGIFVSEEPMTFTHPLLAEAVEADAGVNARGLAHLRAARVLRAAGADATQIAGQLLRSPPTGDPLAVADLRSAAADARARAAPETAAALLRRALSEPPPAEVSAELQIELGLAEQAAGDHGAAWEHLSPTIGDASVPADVALIASLSRLLQGGFVEAIDTVMEAAGARRHANPDDAMRLTATADIFNWFLPLPMRRPVELPPLDGLTGSTPGERMVFASYVSRGVGVGAAAADVATWARASLGGGMFIRDSPLWAELAPGPLLGLLYAEDLESAARELAQIEAAGLQYAWPGALGTARLPLIYQLLLKGEIAAVVAEAMALLELRDTVSGPLRGAFEGFVTGFLLLGVLLHDGPEAADSQLAARGLDGQLPLEMPFALPARAHVHLASGRAEQALADAMQWRAAVEAVSDPIQAVDYHTIEALARLATGDVEGAQESAARELDRARAWGAPGRIAGQLRVSARVEPESAPALLDEALALIEGTELRLERARILLDTGMALRRAGARTEARDALERGVQAASECQAHSLAAQGLEELRVLGGRPRRRAFSGAESLTAGERRVAELAAAGATNREIAQRLFLTVKTIDSHLTRTYRKLGISSRRELAAALATASEELVRS